MTDETRLHEMMANPGPPPDDDTAGWPFRVGDRVLNHATGQAGTVVGPGVRVAVQYSDDPGVVGAGAEWENPADLTLLTDQRLAEILGRNPRPPLAIGDWVTYQERGLGMVRKVDCEPGVVQVLFTGDREPLYVWMGKLKLVAPVLEAGERVRHQGRGVGTVTAVWPGHADGYQADVTFDNRDGLVDTVGLAELRRLADSAGPAPSSASPSGTGGLAEVAELLHTASTAELVQAVFDRWEGVQRALWDLTVAATYQAQIDGWTVAGRASRAVTLRAAYSIVSGISEAAVDKLLATEVERWPGADRRAKGGEPRG